MKNWDPFDWLLAALVLSVIVGVLGHCGRGLYEDVTSSMDKRDCRQAGGRVVSEDSEHTEWHCVGARPERTP